MSLGIFKQILVESNSMGIPYEESSFGINSLSRFSESTVRILELLENVAGRTKSTTFATLTLLHSLKKLEAAESVGGREGRGGAHCGCPPPHLPTCTP